MSSIYCEPQYIVAIFTTIPSVVIFLIVHQKNCGYIRQRLYKIDSFQLCHQALMKSPKQFLCYGEGI